MTVHFIGAGPGAPDLITVRGLGFVRRCPVVLYAGSLVPRAILADVSPGARVVDTAPLTLDGIIGEMAAAAEAGHEVARLHSGDPSLFGAIGEQMRRLDGLGIAYDVTPGVPAYVAAAAALKAELTLPGICQTVILTRTPGRTPMPEGEDLKTLGAAGATLAIHLSVKNLARVVADLSPLYGADCPVVIAHRVSWPEQKIVRGTLADIQERMKDSGITRTALILVGRALAGGDFEDSRLYATEFHHGAREG